MIFKLCINANINIDKLKFHQYFMTAVNSVDVDTLLSVMTSLFFLIPKAIFFLHLFSIIVSKVALGQTGSQPSFQ